MFKKLFVLFLLVCLSTLVGCGGSGSSNSNWDTYQVFSNNLIQPATDNTNLNDYKDATIYFTKNPNENKTLKDWDEEAKFSFKDETNKSFDEETTDDKETIEENSEEPEYLNSTEENNITDSDLTKATDEEEGTLYFGNHKINKSSRTYLLEQFEKDNLADLDGLTYYIKGQGYKADNGQLYIIITYKELK